MKRLAIILFAICFGLKSNAQIQTKFWGLELSSFYYESLETLEGRISDRCKYTQVRDNSIVAMDGKLGGYDWNFVTFRFYKGEFSRGLYAVSFSKNYDTRISAKPIYTLLLESLTNKYGTPIELKNEYTKTSVAWGSKEGKYRCSLELMEGESRGGKMLWYINLDYWDDNLLTLSIKQEEDEL